MEFVFLKTDILFFLILTGSFIYGIYVFRTKNLRQSWKKVFRRPLAASAGIVVIFYVFIATVDSVHLKFNDPDSPRSGELVSFLDLMLWELKNNVEKTYSSPLAYRSFSKETSYLQNGQMIRGFPRLLYGGAHLVDPENFHLRDVWILSFKGFLIGAMVWAISVGLIAGYFRFHQGRFLKGRRNASESDVPWKSMIFTFGVLSVLVGLFCALSPYYHILGTDKVGNDVLYQGIKSIRTGVLIGTLTTIVILPFALFLGICAGYFGGWVDDLVQFLYTTLSSIPGVLLIAASALMLEVYMARYADYYSNLAARADIRLLALCMILGVTAWTGLCRYLRAETLKLREMDFVNAARAFGTPTSSILVKHITPNLMHIVMIAIVLDFSGLVLAEAALTYIDIGVDQSTESWGNMINSARLELAREPIVWWSLATAFFFMLILVLAANIFADAVRDAFDPRVKDR